MKNNQSQQIAPIALSLEQDPGQARARAKQMELYFQEGPSGLLHWMGPGLRMYEKLKSLSARLHHEQHYEQVKSPIIMDLALLEKSGHKDKYGHLIFAAAPLEKASVEDQNHKSEGSSLQQPLAQLALRPMSCPNHIRMFSHQRRSWRELPLRYFEFGEVFRFEPSGSLQELFRQRQFCQDDAHVFCLFDQVQEVANQWVNMAKEAYKELGFGELSFVLSLRPEERLGSDEQWDVAESSLREALRQWGGSFKEEAGGGAFYGPKIEIHIGDGRKSWQMGVFQLDLQLPERFDLKCDGPDAKNLPIIMVHHAVFGSIERMVGVLMEHHGFNLPLWLHPRPAVVIPVSVKSESYARDLARQASKAWGHCELDQSDQPLGAKIRFWKSKGLALVAVVGEQEMNEALSSKKWPAKVNGKAFDDVNLWSQAL